MKNKIGILGCGWLGEPLAYHFTEIGYQVKGSTRNPEKLKRLKDRGVQGFNVTCDLSLELSSFFDVETLIICLTNKDIDIAKQLISVISKSPVKYVVFISSSSVYKAENKQVTENSPLVDSPLVAIEGLFRQADFNTTIVRFAGLIGGERHPGRFFSKGNILKTPYSPINLIHLDDCIQLIDAIIEQKKWNQIYNGCSSTHPPKGVFYTQCAAHGGYDLPILGEEQRTSKIVENQKALSELNFELHHPDLTLLYK